MACQKINITMNENTLARLDKYAKEVNLPRSTAIAVIVNNFLEGRESLFQMSNFMEIYKEEERKKKKK